MKLYGGAISCEIPSDAIDVSTFRQIPDTQEVFLLEKPSALDQSLLFDLLELVVAETLEEVVAVHLDDILEEPAAQLAPLELFLNDNLACEIHSFLVKPAVSKLESETVKLFMLLMIVRAEKAKSDIVITLNVPVECADVTPELFRKETESIMAEPPSQQSILGQAYSVIKKAAMSLDILDWALFD